MMRNALVMVGVLTVWLMGGSSLARAEGRPLRQLPKDVVRFSTIWVLIPQEMYEAGQEWGPLGAVAWGPAKGTAAIGKEVWAAVKPDKRPGHRSEKSARGLLLRYEF